MFVDVDAADRLAGLLRDAADVGRRALGWPRACWPRWPTRSDTPGDHRRRADAGPSTRRLVTAGAPSGSIIVLDRLGDPGNAGAIVRTAEAVGGRRGGLRREHDRPYGPKTVRAAAGSAFRVPLVRATGTIDALEALARRRACTVVGTAGHAAVGRTVEVDLTADTARSCSAARPTASDPTSARRSINRSPSRCAGQVESLNVAAAAAVLGLRALATIGCGGPPRTDG